ncbi:hypothetical protein PS3A_13840 [Pseudomonas sp. 3A(2025)]
MLHKQQVNGYQVISVNHGPWRVCTDHDRLATFNTRDEAMAYAVCLPRRAEKLATQH